MSSVILYFFLWNFVIYKMECAVIPLDRNRNAVEYLLQKYYNPLRKMSANLPNHAIELEIEIHGSLPTKRPSKRFFRLKKPRPLKPIWRAMDGDTQEPGLAPDGAAAPDAGQAPINPPPDVDPIDPSKIPVFMEDLKKALNELEVKLATNPAYAVTTTVASAIAPPPQPYDSPPNFGGDRGPPQQLLNGPVQNIDAILQMLKKAVHIERREPRPGDEKLEWVQLKIPKNMQLF